MVEDLGVEAKEAAVREVAKLLPLPELLQSISSIKADYITRQQVRIFELCFHYLLSASIGRLSNLLNSAMKLLFFFFSPPSFSFFK